MEAGVCRGQRVPRKHHTSQDPSQSNKTKSLSNRQSDCTFLTELYSIPLRQTNILCAREVNLIAQQVRCSVHSGYLSLFCFNSRNFSQLSKYYLKSIHLSTQYKLVYFNVYTTIKYLKEVILAKKCKSKIHYTLCLSSYLRVLLPHGNYRTQSCSHSEWEAQLFVQSRKVEKQQLRIYILSQEKKLPWCCLLDPVLGIPMTFKWSTHTSVVIRLILWLLTEMLLFDFISLSKTFSRTKTLVRSSLRHHFKRNLVPASKDWWQWWGGGGLCSLEQAGKAVHLFCTHWHQHWTQC